MRRQNANQPHWWQGVVGFEVQLTANSQKKFIAPRPKRQFAKAPTKDQTCFRWTVLLAAAFVALSSGCANVAIHDQRLVAKANMLFAESGVFVYQHKLSPQTESGAATSGGGQAAGCTSCK